MFQIIFISFSYLRCEFIAFNNKIIFKILNLVSALAKKKTDDLF